MKLKISADELIPNEVLCDILDGGNPINVWREYRGITQQQLADKIGISKHHLSQIETNKDKGTAQILSAISQVLDVSLEKLATTGVYKTQTG